MLFWKFLLLDPWIGVGYSLTDSIIFYTFLISMLILIYFFVKCIQNMCVYVYCLYIIVCVCVCVCVYLCVFVCIYIYIYLRLAEMAYARSCVYVVVPPLLWQQHQIIYKQEPFDFSV